MAAEIKVVRIGNGYFGGITHPFNFKDYVAVVKDVRDAAQWAENEV